MVAGIAIVILFLMGMQTSALLPAELSKQYVGRVGENIATIFDPNFYFFANHPRERVGITESQRLWFGLWPIFVIGLLELSRNRAFIGGLVFVGLLSSMFELGQDAIAVYPFILVAIVQGFIFIVKKFRYVG